MSFDIFNYRSEEEELKDMFKKLTTDNYAISDLDYEAILDYTTHLNFPVQLWRRHSDGRTRVKRLSQRLPQADSQTEPAKNAKSQETQ